MKRVGYGKSHKVKGSMTMGLAYPVMVDEMVPGDITRIKPEVFIQSVVPPTVPLIIFSNSTCFHSSIFI